MGRRIAAGLDEVVEARCAELAKPRDRIVATAREMFHRSGIHNVGVEAIAEAAGTNKMTLYRHFGSKDELVAECLRQVAAEAEAEWQAMSLRYVGDPMGQLLAWLREVAERVFTDNRGCTLANAAVELTEPDHPARKVIEAKKAAFRQRLVDLCRAAGIAEPELLSDALYLLLEGARVSRQSVGVGGPSATFLRTAEATIQAFRNH